MEGHPAYLVAQRMSSTQKAYFKKFAFKRKSKQVDNYKLLFDILDSLETYDIGSILKHKKLDASIKKNLHVHLSNLYTRLLNSLIDYGRTNFNKTFIAKIEEYTLLKELNLVKLAEKSLRVAINEAKEKNTYYTIPYAHFLMTSNLFNNTSIGLAEFDKRVNDLNESMKELNLVHRCNKLALSLERLIHVNGGLVLKNDNSIEQAKKMILTGNAILSEKDIDFLMESTLTNQILVLQMMTGDYSAFGEVCKRFIDRATEGLTVLKADNKITDASITFKNMAMIAIYFGYDELYESIYPIFEKLISLCGSEKHIDFLELRLLQLRILKFTFSNYSYNDSSLVNEALNVLKKSPSGKSIHWEILLYVLIIFMKRGEYKKVIDKANTLLPENHNNRVRDEYISIRILVAIAWYKLEAYDINESQVRSIYREITHSPHFTLQKQLLTMFRSIFKNQRNMKKLKQEVERELSDVIQNGTGIEKMKALELRLIAQFLYT